MGSYNDSSVRELSSDTKRLAKYTATASQVDYRDLEQESLVCQIRGRKSVTGPMQDFIRKQQLVGSRPKYACRILSIHTAKLPSINEEERLTSKILLQELLGKLTPKLKQAVVLHYIEGLSESDISTRLKISKVTAAQRYWIGLQKLKRMVV